jgi:hypothetical protein
MRLPDFEAMVRRQADQIPAEFLEGIAEITVSPRVVSHPDHPGVWTLGECIPLPATDNDPRSLQSRVVLYFGSFQALARDGTDFDWEQEAWDTLTHEVRHHVEWKARAPDLEAFDSAAEANFARQEGRPFDPGFYRDGVPLENGAWRVDDDVFLERILASVPDPLVLRWSGEDYRIEPPSDLSLPAFLSVSGLEAPPPGELVLVLRSRARIFDLFRRKSVYQATVEAIPLPDYLSRSNSS